MTSGSFALTISSIDLIADCSFILSVVLSTMSRSTISVTILTAVFISGDTEHPSTVISTGFSHNIIAHFSLSVEATVVVISSVSFVLLLLDMLGKSIEISIDGDGAEADGDDDKLDDELVFVYNLDE